MNIDYFNPDPIISTESNATVRIIDHYRDVGVADTRLREALSLTMEEIIDFSPQEKFDRKNGPNCKIGDIHIDDAKGSSKLTKTELLKCISLPFSAKAEMKKLHEAFLKNLKEKILPNYASDIYKGKGIVMVAGGKFTLIGMPAIKAVRENGDKNIPIEIMIPPDNNGESAFCEEVLPELDPTGLSRCVYMEKLFDETTFENVQGYQLKSLALLASSFEEVLLLDADNYVINSISNIFEATPLKERGLVLWPDYWRRLHHPSLYEITDLGDEFDEQVRFSVDNVSPTDVYKLVDVNDVPFHDLKGTIPDGSTESGQLLVNKSKHLDTIILSLYYNYNGPSHYYPLLGQGYAGEGDKDTFALAAKVLHSGDSKESYYQVKTPVKAMGHWALKKDETLVLDDDAVIETEKQYRGVAMLQHDPEYDYKMLGEAQRNISAKYKKALDEYREGKPQDDYKTIYQEFWDKQKQDGYDISEFTSYFKDAPITFVHSNLPKYDPWEFGLFQDLTYDGRKVQKKHEDEPNFKPIRHGHYRMYNDDYPKLSDYDLELANWRCFNDFICKKENGYQNFSYLKEKLNADEDGEKRYADMCAYISDRTEFLLGSTWAGSKY